MRLDYGVEDGSTDICVNGSHGEDDEGYVKVSISGCLRTVTSQIQMVR